jgi:Domain of unknown function DUF29
MASTTKARPAKPATRHEDDLYAWVEEQCALLRAGRVSEVDALNVAEELSDLAHAQYDKLESALTVLTQHLLKWDHQPSRRTRSWALTIREQRRRVVRVLKENPSLKSRLSEAMAEGYDYGRLRALGETKLAESALPESCPYTFDEMMTRVIEID